ncbi:AMP-binding enzyme family protein [Mycobacterium xenopi 4042]|uniref:AMP-binding enzyme family protein n=1 Tax=Mycobacterium xenopi 4042 TaxID=1299334 RepID=X7ZV83_MYCXE|nr:AMP-binding enzyme family protein [Mycobacterium xenopi 4042]
MLGRGSQSINSGGEKIYPEEVEAALKGHPDVFDALVVGVPDERYGQCVAAVVQPRPEHARPWPNSTSSCAARSPDTKCPADFGTSTRSSDHPRASRTTVGPRSRPKRGPPTRCMPTT